MTWWNSPSLRTRTFSKAVCAAGGTQAGSGDAVEGGDGEDAAGEALGRGSRRGPRRAGASSGARGGGARRAGRRRGGVVSVYVPERWGPDHAELLAPAVGRNRCRPGDAGAAVRCRSERIGEAGAGDRAGRFPAGVGARAEREALAGRLLTLYRDHADPGLHGAIDWLLRKQWGKAKELAAIDRRNWRGRHGVQVKVLARGLAETWARGRWGGSACCRLRRVAVGKDWFVNGEGQTFAVVRGPVEFTLGSPPDRAGGGPR